MGCAEVGTIDLWQSRQANVQRALIANVRTFRHASC